MSEAKQKEKEQETECEIMRKKVPVYQYMTIWIPDYVSKKVSELCQKMGYHALQVIRASNWQEDHYLYKVIGSKDSKAYCVWTYNSTTDSLCHGHYNLSLDKAMQKLWDVNVACKS